MGTFFIWCAAGHCSRSSLMTVSTFVRLIALKTHRNSKRILINWANGPGNRI